MHERREIKREGIIGKLYDIGKEFLKARYGKSLPEDVRKDIIQNAVIYVRGREDFWRRYKGNKNEAIGYFYRILRSRSINYFERDTKREKPITRELEDIENPFRYALIREAEDKSYRLLGYVYSDKKLVFSLNYIYMKYYRGKTYEEMSMLTGKPKSTIDNIVKRGIRRIREIAWMNGFITPLQVKIFIRLLFDKVSAEYEFSELLREAV